MVYSKIMNTKPVIAVSMGDPAGIGPEIIVKALADPQTQKEAFYLITGDRSVLENACSICGISKTILDEDFVEIINMKNSPVNSFTMGEVSAACGRAAYEYIEKACSLAVEGRAKALCTAPINKESLRAAGVPFIGHTEILSELTNTKDPLTLFEVRDLRVFFLSRHVSLKQACALVKKDRIIDYVKRCTEALSQLGIQSGTMAIAGLNPHSGEHGLFGNEEVEEVEPAVRALKEMGFSVEGPVGADSVFYQALTGKYNSVLSLYHDQGHIATKTLDFERTISITCGMKILRTSVDHGTAFDIAGTGRASEVSMIEALRLAVKYSKNY